MDFDELHRAAVARQNRERAVAQVTAPQGVRVRGFGRNGRRATDACVSKAVDDVFRFDAWPHDDAQLGELGAHVGEAFGELSLFGVELGRELEERGLLGDEGGVFFGSVRRAAVPLRATCDWGHESSPDGSWGSGSVREGTEGV